jgi:penicillin-insensitive murein endopeptidase
MIARLTALFVLTFALVAGSLAVADRLKVAQAPQAPAAQAPSVVTPVPAAPVVVAPVAPPAAVTSEPLPPPVAAAPPAEPAPATFNAALPPPPAAAAATTVATPMPPAKPAPAEDKKAASAEDKEPAKQLFSHTQLPSLGKAMAIGYYPRGCLQGGVELPVDGPTWQVMRLSRNRNWGHPELVHFLEKFAPLAAKATGWNGIMVGDMAQPRGGPLPFGHMSHQIGLDVDIWFMPMPDHRLSKEEREKLSASNLVADDWKHVNPKTWTPADIAFIRTAAEQPEVERVLVNAAIKKELCEAKPKGKERWSWLDKVRPWFGHHDHIHVRLKCPADSPNCRKQPPVPGDDGCGAHELDYWFSDKVLHPKITEPKKPPKPLTLADLPPACKNVLDAPANPKAAER